jgi:hypothetical protein
VAQDFEPDPLVDSDRNSCGDGQHRQRVNPYAQQRDRERADRNWLRRRRKTKRHQHRPQHETGAVRGGHEK